VPKPLANRPTSPSGPAIFGAPTTTPFQNGQAHGRLSLSSLADPAYVAPADGGALHCTLSPPDHEPAGCLLGANRLFKALQA